ncbi:MAG: prephenate dehydratase [Saprospiraceae bacterium]
MNRNIKIAVQGVSGCFHEEAARKFFGHHRMEAIAAHNFEILADIVANDHDVHYGIMAIENSIAGSILQNYRILRENNFWITGEVYLRIEHNLMALPGQTLEDITDVASHPMALNQCLKYLKSLPHIKLIETADTALSAQHIRDNHTKNRAAVASKTAAKLYDLEILAASIETSKQNYTRFFIISRESEFSSIGNADKASIYLRVPDKSGSLLNVLQTVADQNINISKLQSYPVLNELNQYYFHLDLEFDLLSHYENVIEELKDKTIALDELGIYKRATIHDSVTIK